MVVGGGRGRRQVHDGARALRVLGVEDEVDVVEGRLGGVGDDRRLLLLGTALERVAYPEQAGGDHRARRAPPADPPTPPAGGGLRRPPAAPATSPATDDPGALPQTDDKPVASGATFDAGVQGLWQAVQQDRPELAMPFFFPQRAYLQVK